MEVIAWLVLRVIYAWMFIYPIKALVADWDGTKNTVRLLTPVFVSLSAMVMILVMFVGGLMILLGVYAQLAGIALCAYCLIGYYIHSTIGKGAFQTKLETPLSANDSKSFEGLKTVALIGHVTSAQKNIVLAAVGFYFAMLGSGPVSLTNNLF